MRNSKPLMLMLLLYFSISTFSQEPEWEYCKEYKSTDVITPNILHSMIELKSGDIIVSSAWSIINNTGYLSESEFPSIMKFSSDGQLLKEKQWYKQGYRSDEQYLIETEDNKIIVMGTYNPDRDRDSPNYFPNGKDAFLYFYKLDSDFNMIDSIEYRSTLDTTYCEPNILPNQVMAKIRLTSCFVEDGNIIGSCLKNETRTGNMAEPYPIDSIFLFKMDFGGNIIQSNEIRLGEYSANLFCFGNLMISNDSCYVHYDLGYENGNNKNDWSQIAVLFDKNFNLIKSCKLPPNYEPGYCGEPRWYDYIMVGRSPWGTTYLTGSMTGHTNNGGTCPNACLVEIEDDKGSLTVLNRTEKSTNYRDYPALWSPADFGNDCIYWAYTLNRGFFYDQLSWINIDKLDRDMNVIKEVFFIRENTNIGVLSYTKTKDDGLLMITYGKGLNDMSENSYTYLTKFPAEAFVGIEEAHKYGLKMAVAYPNPGNNRLNIKTGLDNAAVEIFDIQGRKIFEKEISENVTTVNTDSWNSGMYLWNVKVEGKTVESGKWVRQ